ncbi:MAG: hypothetical protein M1829_004659 [Trizodia sp. TS-e1964]|nr:MAG: hypothetical protein M1829_004659 [Trizodia sp. TS-e1964]
MKLSPRSWLCAALVLATPSLAQTSKFCPSGSGGPCYSVNIPASTASSSSGDIFFQITVPTTFTWAALGQGGQMAGANIFIIYSSASGNNVTLSPRSGVGEFQPKFNSQAQVTLIEGTGISGGMMTANVRCSNCLKWSGGTLDTSSTTSDWIWSAYSGDPLNSDNTGASLSQHNAGNAAFTFNLQKATGGSSLNPFIVATSSGTNSTTSPPGTNSTSSSGYDDGSSGSSSASSAPVTKLTKMRIAHGVIASLALLIFFPLGVFTLRLLNFNGLVWVHASIQIFAYAMAIAALGMGVWLATNLEELGEYHPIIGLTVISLLFFQPFLGHIHHYFFVRKGTRTLWSYAHIWLGRTLIALGIINGGLGLRLANNSTNGKIIYGVVAGVVFLIYLGVVFFDMKKRRGNAVSREKAPRGGVNEHGDGVVE